MTVANPEWPVLLRNYEAAIAEFESVSRALTAALTERSGSDDDLSALVTGEAAARERVLLARMRLVNLWRASGADFPAPRVPMSAVPIRDR